MSKSISQPISTRDSPVDMVWDRVLTYIILYNIHVGYFCLLLFETRRHDCKPIVYSYAIITFEKLMH